MEQTKLIIFAKRKKVYILQINTQNSLIRSNILLVHHRKPNLKSNFVDENLVRLAYYTVIMGVNTSFTVT